MKYHFDIAAEMVKIAESAEHQKSMEKLAFSREGKEEVSEVEEEMKKLASDCKCEEDCDGDCGCECHEKEGEKKEASVSLEDTAGLLLEISTELEDQGMDRLAAATIVLADSILKTAAAKKKSPDSGKSGSSSSSSSGSSSSSSSGSSKKDKKPGKKMSMKERMEKMRAAQKGKKGKKPADKSSKKK
jgi:hypothetical protein